MKLHKLIAITFAICCAAVALGAGKARDSDLMHYSDPARTFFERFGPDPKDRSVLWWEGGNIIPKRRTPEQKRDFYFDEVTSERVRDCSDVRYRCLYGLHRVFAIPRGGLELQSQYVVGGAVFRVEQCFRGDEKQCQVALISSDCQSLAEPDRCMEVTGGRSQSISPGRVGYFIFNEDFGVTAYGSLKEPATTAEARLAAATEMILRGDKGLLSNE